MKITFEKKFLENDHLVIVYLNGTKNLNSQYPNDEVKSLVNNFQKVNNKKNEIIETLNFNANDSLQSITLAKIKDNKDDFKESKLEAFGGRILSYLEKKKKKNFLYYILINIS